ncbi:VirB8/TrbF family protein [Arthrobacter woluwensis]|uniref:VirB8/TrbF family protein n=1 Tax=Arthrobacter woluwensis TaxID=156980 RepID=UPI00381374CD
MKQHRKALIISAVLVLLVAVVALISTLARPHEESRPAPSFTTAQPTNLAGDIPSPVPSTAAPSQEQQAKDVAVRFIHALTSQSSQDPTATTWLDRTRAYTTAEEFARLQQLYRTDTGWQSFVSREGNRSVQIEYVDAQETAPGRMVVAIRYQLTTALQGPAETRTQPVARMLTLTRSSSGWSVASMTELAGGYAPATPHTPTAPSQAPTIRDG